MLKKAAIVIGFLLSTSQIFGSIKAYDQGIENITNALNKTQSARNSQFTASIDEETFCKGLRKRLTSAEAIIEYDNKCQKKY